MVSRGDQRHKYDRKAKKKEHLPWDPNTQVKKGLPFYSWIRNNVTSLLLLLFSFFSHQFQWPPRASNAHIVRHFSRHLAALETLSWREEKGTSHETPARPRGDWKSPAAGLTDLLLCQVGEGSNALRVPDVLDAMQTVLSWARVLPLSCIHTSVNFPPSSIIWFPESN